MITLAEFTSEHLVLLPSWLEEPHVRPWYPLPDDDIANAIGICDAAENGTEDSAGHFLICDGPKPIGYLRWQLVPKAILDEIGLSDIPDNSADVDLFIGESSEICQGAGAKALAAVEEKMSARGDVPLIGLTTNKENHYAHKAFEKAGYVIGGEYTPDDYGDCFLFIKHLK